MRGAANSSAIIQKFRSIAARIPPEARTFGAPKIANANRNGNTKNNPLTARSTQAPKACLSGRGHRIMRARARFP